MILTLALTLEWSKQPKQRLEVLFIFQHLKNTFNLYKGKYKHGYKIIWVQLQKPANACRITFKIFALGTSDEWYNVTDKTFDRFVTVPGRIHLNHYGSRPIDLDVGLVYKAMVHWGERLPTCNPSVILAGGTPGIFPLWAAGIYIHAALLPMVIVP